MVVRVSAHFYAAACVAALLLRQHIVHTHARVHFACYITDLEWAAECTRNACMRFLAPLCLRVEGRERTPENITQP